MNDRIIKALSGFYYVQTPDGVVECRARGRFRKEGVSPLVGDFVRISRSGKSGTVEEILPRKNSFIRPAVANVDLLVLLASCAIPQTEPFLIDRVAAIAELKDKGVWVFGTAAEGSIPMYKADLTVPAAIVIGNEGEGLSQLVRKNCDVMVSIPMKGKISSLNASAAASILLYEAVRQRIG